jgi:hypothetical protein
MLGTAANSVEARRPSLIVRLFRLTLGYVVAVAGGSIVFALLFPLAVPDMLPPHSVEEWFNGTFGMTITTFVLGFLFGLPYTILGLLAFRSVLTRSMPVFLLVGTLCPSAAIATMGLLLGLHGWFNVEKIRIMIFSMPAGLVAAYLFGAIGFGQGFGRWRFK